MQQICPHHADALLDGNAQSVRYGEIIHDGSGQLDSANSQDEADSEIFVMGSDAAEFVNKVKKASAKKTEKNVERCRLRRRTFNNLGNVSGCDDECAFMGKNFLDNQNSIKNSTDLTLKKMFDISEKLVSEQEEINNVDKIHWKNHSWKQLSLIGDETVINLQRAKVYVFSDSVLCLGKVHSHPGIQRSLEEKDWMDHH